MNTTFRVFLTSAIGAFIGVVSGLVSLQFNPTFVSILIGAGVGFIAGYLLYDVPEIIESICLSARRIYSYSWRKWAQENRHIFIHCTGLLGIILSCAANGIIADVLLNGQFPLTAKDLGFYSFISSALSIVIFILFVGKFYSSDYPKLSIAIDRWLWLGFIDKEGLGGILQKTVGDIDDQYSWLVIVGYIVNPLIVFVILPLFLAGTILYFICKVAWATLSLALLSIKGFPQFSKRTFILIHSKKRLLCGTDAAFGALAGLYWHNVLLGAVVGGILGVINYQLVSIRWLKLVPAPTNK